LLFWRGTKHFPFYDDKTKTSDDWFGQFDLFGGQRSVAGVGSDFDGTVVGDAGSTATFSPVDGQDGVAVGCDCALVRIRGFVVSLCCDFFSGGIWLDDFEELAKARDGSVAGDYSLNFRVEI
jgi:hypothetical protein